MVEPNAICDLRMLNYDYFLGLVPTQTTATAQTNQGQTPTIIPDQIDDSMVVAMSSDVLNHRYLVLVEGILPLA